MSEEIRPLQQNLIRHLRSGINISSVAVCVEELVLNALDAGASYIAVKLDLPFYKIVVVDNGSGISRGDFDAIGQRYSTSKCHSIQDLSNLQHYGFRGEALASLSQMCSVLEITSRTSKSNLTYFKRFVNGDEDKTIISQSQLERPSVGTTVTALNFMYNMPVRQNLISNVRDLEECRRSIECIALMNPKVTFMIRNDSIGEVCLQTKKSNEILTAFKWIFGHQVSANMKLLEFSTDSHTIQGYVNLDAHNTKEYQFIYVNKRLVQKTKLHQVINQMLTKSLIGKQQKVVKDLVSNSQSPRTDRHGIYIINITAPLNSYDITFDPRKTLLEFENWDSVLKIFKAAIINFLQIHGYLFEEETEKVLNKTNQAEDPSEYGDKISTKTANNVVASFAAKRSKTTKLQSPERVAPADYTLPSNPESILDQNPTTKTSQNYLNESLHFQNTAQDFITPIGQGKPHEEKQQFSKMERSENSKKLKTPPKSTVFKSTLGSITHRKHAKTSLESLKKYFQYNKSIGNQKEQIHNSHPMTEGQSNSHQVNQDPPVAIHTLDGHKSARNYESEAHVQKNQAEPKKSEYNSSNHVKTLEKGKSRKIKSQFTHVIEKPVCEEHRHKQIHSSQPHLEQISKSKATFESKTNQKPEKYLNRNLFSTFGQNQKESFAMPNNPEPIELNFLGLKSSTYFEEANCQSTESLFTIIRNQDSPINSSQNSNTTEPFDVHEELVTQPFFIPAINSTPPVDELQSTLVDKATEIHSEKEIRTNSPSLYKVTELPQPNLQKENPFEHCNQTKNHGGIEVTEIDSNTLEETGNYKIYQEKLPFTEEQNSNDDLMEGWIAWKDPDNGCTLYINKKMGNSTFVKPVKKQQIEVNVQKQRHFFLSHNGTEFLPRENRKVAPIIDGNTAEEITSIVTDWQNPVFQANEFQNICKVTNTKDTMRTYSSLHGYRFYKSMFGHVQVIGQIDCKFIACLVPSEIQPVDKNLMVFFDQHAAHERIRLESLMNDLYIMDSDPRMVKNSRVQPPLILNIGLEFVRLARAYPIELEKLGLNFELSELSSISVHTAPSCLIEHEVNEAKRGRRLTLTNTLEKLVKEQLTRLQERGLGPALPKTLQNVLNSQACHGAIKFGDKLTMDECKDLISALGMCDLPFQCAHGRPSLVPILDMNYIKRPLEWKISRPKLYKLTRRIQERSKN